MVLVTADCHLDVFERNGYEVLVPKQLLLFRAIVREFEQLFSADVIGMRLGTLC